ncbi:MAG: hypothetical protein KF757_13055 [Phycisphaeraceae bacterium]|nr:hypothetical protein [Phycisphaeraceae bacterium]
MSTQVPIPNGDGADPGLSEATLTPAEIALALETYYPRLKGLVWAQMVKLTGRSPDQFTETPTVHTNDLCMALLNQRKPFRDAEHLMAVASIRCTRIVVDYLRKRGRAKRGGGNRGVPLATDTPDGRPGPEAWLMRDGIEDALTRFAEEHPRKSQALMLRAFMGRSTADISEMLGISTATVERELKAARAYLQASLSDWNESIDERSATHK